MRKSLPLSTRWRIRNDELKIQQHKNCLHQPLTQDLGHGHSNICLLDSELSYIETEYKPSKDLAVLSQMENQQPRLVVTLGLEGSSSFVSSQGNEIIFNKGYTSITTFNSSIGERQYQANQSILQLRFSMTKNWLQRYVGDTKTDQLFNTKSVKTISYKPITAQGMMIAQKLNACNVNEEIKKLFVHGQTMMLLASELSPVLLNPNKSKEKYTADDKKRINMARDILYQEFNQPPSVEQLSRQVGCNQFKLKKLFHHFFNNTPYGMLLEIRMNKAYQLLESSGCHVNIAADYVGYSHASNFSTAFIKYFGVSPKSIAQKKASSSK